MEELDKNVEGGGETAIRKPPMKERLENFWYHYKWHSLVALFLIITVLVCSLQMCTRTSYDIYITYAGYREVKRTAVAGGSPYGEMVGSLERITGDLDGDGETNVSLRTLFIPSEEERELLLSENENLEINEALVTEDRKTLDSEIVFGDNYVYFLSESLFLEYEDRYDGGLFLSLSELGKNTEGVKFASDNGNAVYLSSLKISSLPVLCDLPDDTVVCMRNLSEVSQVFGKAQNEENYRRGLSVIEAIFSFE